MIVCAPWASEAALRGPRILLRPLQPDDAAELLAALEESRAHFFPWLRFPDRLRTLDDCRDHIVRAHADWLRGESYGFALRDGADGRLLGGVDLFLRGREAGLWSIGYWLRASEQGHGYMREAGRLVTRFALHRAGASRVEITCDARNIRSAAVARQLGYTYEGALRHIRPAPDGAPLTVLIFARILGDPLDGLYDE